MLRKMMPLSRLAETVFWLAVAIGGGLLTLRFSRALSNYDFTSATWPRLILAGIGVVAVLQFLAERDRKVSAIAAAWRPGLPTVLAMVGGYLLALTWIGFYLATPVFMFFSLLVLGERRLPRAGAFALLASAFFFLVFTTFFYIAMPAGALDGLLDANIAIRETFLALGSIP
ncbi:tripartite tricarboxylate transporter TctB family protein [Geminicoccaceae bacterium 1502E]|nr:tripartite tricarboxylate transporter TctB family protein [Geminicoccaceae bacterium 1502E]